jgi:ABC-type lipoprotein export system ATPase subunit
VSETGLKARAAAIRDEQRAGFVSPDIPLLSNLSVYDNISLVPRYLTTEKDESIRAEIGKLLDLLKISDSINKKTFQLDSETLFKVKLLRALMLKESVTVIDRPFIMLNTAADIKPVYAILETLDISDRRVIFLDFEWNKSKY